MNVALFAAHELLCLALFFVVISRSAKAGHMTRHSIKLTLLCTGAAGATSAAAPLYGWQPSFISLVILASLLIVVATERRLH